MNVTKNDIPFSKIDKIVNSNVYEPPLMNLLSIRSSYERVWASAKIPLLKMYLYRVYQVMANYIDTDYAMFAVEGIARGIVEVNNYWDIGIECRNYCPIISILDLLSGYKIKNSITYTKFVSGVLSCFKDVNKVDLDLCITDLIPAILKLYLHARSVNDKSNELSYRLVKWKSIVEFILEQVITGPLDSHSTTIVIDDYEASLSKIDVKDKPFNIKKIYKNIRYHVLNALSKNINSIRNIKIRYNNTYITRGKKNVIHLLKTLNTKTSLRNIDFYKVFIDNSLDYRSLNDMYRAHCILSSNNKRLNLEEFTKEYEGIDTSSTERIPLSANTKYPKNIPTILSTADSSVMKDVGRVAKLNADEIILMSTSSDNLEGLLYDYMTLCVKILQSSQSYRQMIRGNSILISIQLSDPEYEDVISKVASKVCSEVDLRNTKCVYEIVYE